MTGAGRNTSKRTVFGLVATGSGLVLVGIASIFLSLANMGCASMWLLLICRGAAFVLGVLLVAVGTLCCVWAPLLAGYVESEE